MVGYPHGAQEVVILLLVADCFIARKFKLFKCAETTIIISSTGSIKNCFSNWYNPLNLIKLIMVDLDTIAKEFSKMQHPIQYFMPRKTNFLHYIKVN